MLCTACKRELMIRKQAPYNHSECHTSGFINQSLAQRNCIISALNIKTQYETQIGHFISPETAPVRRKRWNPPFGDKRSYDDETTKTITPTKRKQIKDSKFLKTL